MKFSLLRLTPLLALFACLSFAGRAAAQSNVLLIVADDMGVDQLSSYAEGADPALTPNLDALAASGVLFRNAWSCPSCSPTRSTIMTGRYGRRTGIGFIINADLSEYSLQDQEITLPEMLDAGTNNAWEHGFLGKWHLSNQATAGDNAPNLAGWGHFAGTPTNLRPPETYYNWRKVTNGASQMVTDYATTTTVDDAISFIGGASGSWLCFVSFHAPHSPFHEPPAALHSVDLTGVTPRQNAQPFYKAMIEAMDAEIGRLLGSMTQQTLDDTMVIFVGDNGTPGLPVLPPFDPNRSKGRLYEGGINVPFIVSGAGVVSGGRESAALVHTVDLFNTVADVAGVDLATTYPGVEFDGESLVPILDDPAASFGRPYAYSERFAPNDASGPTTAAICPQPGQEFCQEDLGFQGPGTVELAMCGDELYGGAFLPLTITGARPNSIAYLLRSAVSTPVPIFGGMLAAFPPTTILPGLTDANGEITVIIFAGTQPTESYFQVGVLDDTYPEGVAFSNCVRAETLTTHIRAVRNYRYKLISNESNCQDQFYDLLVDPFEMVDLLSLGALSFDELSQYRSLKAQLETP